MKKKVLAVSGGVDSVVMLDLMMKSGLLYHKMNNSLDNYASDDIIVAHFDHGIRGNSREDAAFVEKLAGQYGLKCVIEQGHLSEEASEAEARGARYAFLRKIAGANGEIYVAHHLDDLIETIEINFIRGTGWRGLAVMEMEGIRRPLLEGEMLFEPMDKAAILEYAAKRGLHFREDQSNSSDEYLRNRIRHQMNNSIDKLAVYELWRKQKELKYQIDRLVNEIIPRNGESWQREWFRRLDDEEDRKAAIELLRAGTLSAGISATRPQLENFRQAILKYKAGKSFNLPQDKLVKFTKDEFWL